MARNGINIFQVIYILKYAKLGSLNVFRKSWSDDRLSWEPENFSGIREITLPVDKIWVTFYLCECMFTKHTNQPRIFSQSLEWCHRIEIILKHENIPDYDNISRKQILIILSKYV